MHEGFHWQLIGIFSSHWHMVPVIMADYNICSPFKRKKNLFSYPESGSNFHRMRKQTET